MTIWRRWVLPLLTVAVLAAIASALVKIAFFPDSVEAATTPDGAVAQPVVTVERGSITDELDIDATVARDEPVVIRSEVDGTVTAVEAAVGDRVEAGAVLYTVKQAYPVRTIEIVAPESGELTELSLVKGQSTMIGGEVAALTPERFHLIGTVDPVLLYRLVNAPAKAAVTIQGGPAPFTCTDLDVTVAEDATTSVVCAVPGDEQVFAGLKAALSIRIGSADDALLVPTTAVKGGSGTGVVWVDADGIAEERTVELGVTDGTRVQVTDGLADGDVIREFVPGQTEGDEPVCYDDGYGGQWCEEPGMSW